jgi:hypothetical protein
MAGMAAERIVFALEPIHQRVVAGIGGDPRLPGSDENVASVAEPVVLLHESPGPKAEAGSHHEQKRHAAQQSELDRSAPGSQPMA